MSKALRPFAWLGRGTLSVRYGEGLRLVKLYFPGEIVEEAAHLAALGAERIVEILANGSGTLELERDVGGGLRVRRSVDESKSTPEDRQLAQTVAQETLTRSLEAQEGARDAADRERQRQHDALQVDNPVPAAEPASLVR